MSDPIKDISQSKKSARRHQNDSSPYNFKQTTYKKSVQINESFKGPGTASGIRSAEAIKLNS